MFVSWFDKLEEFLLFNTGALRLIIELLPYKRPIACTTSFDIGETPGPKQ